MEATFLILMLLIYLVVLGGSVALYVLSSLGVYTIAKRRGIRNCGLAWVPVGNLWVIGAIADQFESYRRGKPVKLRWWLLGLSIAMVVVMIIMYAVAIGMMIDIADMAYSSRYGYGEDWAFTYLGSVGIFWFLIMVFSIAASVLEYICLYRLFLSCRPEHATVSLVLSIFLSVSLPFLLFSCRKYDAPLQAGAAPYGQPVQPPYSQPPYGAQPPYNNGAYQPPYQPYNNGAYQQPNQPYNNGAYQQPNQQPYQPPRDNGEPRV